MTLGATVQLAHGLLRDGAWRRDAVVRPLSGYEEDTLELGGLSPAERATELLVQCTECLAGEPRPVARTTLRELTVGDRETLLMSLYRCTFGDRVAIEVTCPRCAARLDVDLSVGDLLVSRAPAPAERYRLEAVIGGETVVVTFRLPTGADHEHAAGLAADLDAAVAELVRGCVVAVEPQTPLAALAPALGDRIAQLDPQAETALDVSCEACDERFMVLLDAGELLASEVTASGLLREIHELALAYHWDEREILGLATPRRRRYLALLAEEAA